MVLRRSAESFVKSCPFCLGQIPYAAMKCQHCGEWVDGRPPQAPTDPLGRAANQYVRNWTALRWAGFALAVLVVLVVFLPVSCQMQRRSEQFPSFPGMPSDFKHR